MNLENHDLSKLEETFLSDAYKMGEGVDDFSKVPLAPKLFGVAQLVSETWSLNYKVII